MTIANVVFSGPADAVKPIAAEAKVAAGQTIYPGMLVSLTGGEWVVHGTPDVGGDIYVIDMDVVGQKLVTDILTAGQSYQAFVPQVGFNYNLFLAAAQVITQGESLSSSGTGAVKSAATNGSSEALFVADEAVTTTIAANGRIRARYNPTGVNALI